MKRQGWPMSAARLAAAKWVLNDGLEGAKCYDASARYDARVEVRDALRSLGMLEESGHE